MKDAKNIINGTWGTVWLDGELVSECTALQAKVTLQKTAVNFCNDLFTHQKVTGMEGKGTLKLHKVNSRMIKKLSDNIKSGKPTVCEIVSALADPQAIGAERVALHEVSLDELTLADWEVKKNLEESIPFTFSDWDFLETIDVE